MNIWLFEPKPVEDAKENVPGEFPRIGDVLGKPEDLFLASKAKWNQGTKVGTNTGKAVLQKTDKRRIDALITDEKELYFFLLFRRLCSDSILWSCS